MKEFKVLVVDDEEGIRDSIKEFLECKYDNPKIYECEDGDSALQDVKDRKGALNLVITDYQIPGIDGIIFLKRMKNLYPKIRVIVMSGIDIKKLAILSGADAFLRKPFTLAQLLEIVNKLL